MTFVNHLDALEQMALSQKTIARLLMACAMGAVVGAEREVRHKASGLRTNILICMGAALFTMLSIAVAGEASPNKGQIASNIVQGIGFLGAGMILHERNRVMGLTSAATVWVVAAIGMGCGAGLYLEAAIATLIVYVSLKFIGVFESRSRWKRVPMLYEVRGSDEGALLAGVLAVLDKEHLRLDIVNREKLGSVDRVTFVVSASVPRHKLLLSELRASDATSSALSFPGEDED